MRNPNSRRGRQEAERLARVTAIDATRTPEVVHQGEVALECPAGLPESVAALWRKLVEQLIAAKVEVQAIDSHAIEMAARCMETVRQAEQISSNPKADPKLRLDAMRLGSQSSRELQQWLTMIGATPAGRVRIGVKQAPAKKMGPLAQLLAAKQARKA